MDWQELARRQAGAVARPQLRACGLTEDEVEGLVGRREIVTLLPGVYRSRATPDSPDQCDWAAVLWSGGVLSHHSAARRWPLPVDGTARTHVTVADRRFRGTVATWVQVHRVDLPASEVARVAGLAVTTRSRTIIDLLRVESYGRARDLRDRALQLGWVSESAIARSISAQLGRTGNVQLRRLLAEIEAGAQAESERLLHAILRQAGVRGWRPQYRVRVGSRTAYLDVALPAARIAIEVDGRAAHGPWSDRFDDDRERQNALQAAGWRVLRFTWAHLQDPEYVIRAIAQLLPV